MDIPAPTTVFALVLALGFGVGFALSFYSQIQLQRRARAGLAGASFFLRLTMAGLSMSFLFSAVLLGKASTTLPEGLFMSTFFASAVIAFIVRWRSNSTPHPDARDVPANTGSGGARAGERER